MKEKFRGKRESAPPVDEVRERPHPMMKVPGIGTRAVWSRRLGRWIVPVIGGEISNERDG